MKRLFYVTIVCLLAITTSVQATNDYLEQPEHYTVMNMGNGVYRFTIPVWVFGYINNYYLDSKNLRNDKYDSYIWYSLKPNSERGTDDIHRIATVAGKRYGYNVEEESDGRGEGFIYVHSGSVVIQNLKDGTKISIPQDDGTYWDNWEKSLVLKRKNDDGHQDITYIEFDWYPPQGLAGKDFYWGVSANIYKYYDGKSHYKEWFPMEDRLNLSDPQSPELFTPYLYALNEEGITGYGNAAVQYVTYQQGISYHTSYNSNEVPISENAGAIIVPTTDSVQRKFNATFKVNMTNDTNNLQVFTLKTNSLNIPAYHRIYDFGAEEILDEQQSVTGKVKLSWGIRCPGAEDLLEGDVFQIERALSPDFSDAQSIAVKSFFVDSASYTHEDDPTAVLLEDTTSNTGQSRRISEEGKYYAFDENGDIKIQYYARLTSNRVFEPGKTVYYRVRRGSSAVWEWHEPFARSTELKKNNYLAPLALEQEPYTKDPDYETNRKVHFRFKLENKAVSLQPEAESQCELKTFIQRVNGEIPLRIHFRGSGGVNINDYKFKFYYLPPEGSLQQLYMPLENDTLKAYVETGGMVQVSVVNKDGYSAYTLNLIGELEDKAAYIADVELYPASGKNLNAHINEDEEAMQTAMNELMAQYPLPDTARHALYEKILEKTSGLNAINAHRNWDRNAILYLQRISVETGDTIEFPVPADSIIRQEDGSWTAHMVNTADFSCTHYRYAVRLDQAGSVLKVLDPLELEPIALNGPDLYYNDVADIARFDASQGTDRYGIILTWEPTPGGVDFYELSRRVSGSTNAFTLVTKTEENDFRDNAIVPGAEYEYRLMASYTCNDTTTTSFATTTGYRSPYGLISGRIHYADGTGCPGVKIRLESEGISDLETVTDETGRYAFDNLLYGAGKDYSIIPTSGYAEFRFNNTSMTTASVTLNADNPVAEGIAFDNISSVRFSGRILYSKSSIPVRDANILLDSSMVYTAGGPLKTDASGNFELQVPKNHPFTLQAVKEGHTFEGEGYVVKNNSRQLVLDKALDGVRIWDATKVRLAGRVVGGKKQADLKLGFGYSTNNLGDDLQLVLELEGDNISQIVRDPDDLTRDTFNYTVPHVVHLLGGGTDTVGTTQMHYQKKRIIINPDPVTGEYCADLFPVRYKVTQATAKGYSTLFTEGKTSDVIDLSNVATREAGEADDDKTVHWNEKYCVTYRSPIDISCIQMRYGIPMPYYGEAYMTRKNVLNQEVQIPLAEKDSNGVYQYTFGHPVFPTANYTFRIKAHEDYYYNNDKNSPQHEQVSINGGQMKVYNGLHASEETQTLSALFPKWEQATQHFLLMTKETNEEGQIDFTIPVDYVSFNKTGDQAVRVLKVSIESDGRYIEKDVLKAYIIGNRLKGRDYMTQINAGPELLDVLRDPPGAGSYAFLEKGTSFDYSFAFDIKTEFGVNLNFKYGTSKSFYFGSYLKTTAGIPGPFSGTEASASVSVPFSIPISSGFTWKRGGSYTFTTNDRIETASDNWFVGSRGDIYIGTIKNVLLELTDAVKPLDSLSYSTMAAQMIENVGVTGKSATVAEGRAMDGNKYYLAIGEEIAGSFGVNGSFAYSQDYILTVVLPQLLKERNALLVTGDSATVQALADLKGSEIYWSHVLPTDTTYALGNYEKVIPTGDSEKMWANVDRVKEYNSTIAGWLKLIRQNEDDKYNVLTNINADHVGNYSVSNGVKLSHTESYDAMYSNVFYLTGMGGSFDITIGENLPSALLAEGNEALAGQMQNFVNMWAGDNSADPFDLSTEMPGAKTEFSFTPILKADISVNPDQSTHYTRTAGFVLEPDEYSYMNVDVFRRRETDNDYNKQTGDIQNQVDDGSMFGNDYHKGDHLYGSYVYRLNGGATKCPWEGPEESLFYSQGGRPVQLSTGTLKLENPTIDILDYEVSDIPRDQPAIIHIRLANETQQTFESYVVFKLVLVDASNPHGAKVLMDGFPLTGDGRAIKLNPGQSIDKTLEVYAGEGYDFENLTLMLASNCDILNFKKASFSVHFQPTSCDVNIATPHDKWVMNTLSPKDSTGWYLPVVIDGYDINYPNFDHIEFQYKLSKQSDDGWVNLCSYYADSTYYNEASGSKAMLKAGRIENIAFYGERDPIEQQYDLRAVSFCRYGTSYLTKSSPVLTGIKDTRVPRVFGEPEPANSILGVGDNLLLRFNEPIAGNYLDEDNNFQITGITNATGFSTATALHFDGNASATTKAKRDLADKSFTIDMMIRPTEANNRANDMILFETGDGQVTRQLILTKDNRLRLIKKAGNTFLAKSSKRLGDILAFSRIVCVSEKNGKTRFYLGTEDVTDNLLGESSTPEQEGSSAYFTFGSTYDGDMLETRIWTKALTLEEISATANRWLTGYERELLAYYRMDEGKGENVTDYAHGATLYLDGCSWNKQQGYSLRLDGEAVPLNGNLLGRSAIYDETLMFWFKAETNGTLFSSSEQQWDVPEGYADGEWHHFVLTISRTYNNAALFLDGKIVRMFDAITSPGITGAMYLGGNGFKGNIDEFVIFEQALPKSLVEAYEDIALTGDEMGLMAYLPFEEQYTNLNGIIEQRFSINDQRTFKDANGNVVNKVVPLIIGTQSTDRFADGTQNAPIKSKGTLNKLYFDWSFNNDELMVNILNRDIEINKQSIYVTVRDVEDLNGNPMTSPVTWTAFVDRNALKWSDKLLRVTSEYKADFDQEVDIRIINQSGKRHQFAIESLQPWLTADMTSGSLEPMEEKIIRLTFDNQIAVGEYSDIIYLTDEDGLSEPLQIEYNVEAVPPYDDLDESRYPQNMSICAQVLISTENGVTYDSDERDIVYALYRNTCVGQANVQYNPVSNRSDVYLTVLGTDEMNRKLIRFQLWQASTGKVYDLTPSIDVLFSHGFVYGCGEDKPFYLTTGGSEMQHIDLAAGWNWVSTNLDLTATQGALTACMTAAQPWTEGDIIKNPNTRQFSTYDEVNDLFVGTLTNLHCSQMYMVYAAKGNGMRISGEKLPEDSMKISVRGDGQWSPLPCLFDQRTSVTEALADYYQKAGVGDMIKSHNRFATFSADKRWVGNLTAIQPGEGYLFRRLAPGTVEIGFYNKSVSAPKRAKSQEPNSQWSNPKAATNMTMIACVMANDLSPLTSNLSPLKVYVGDELAAVAEPLIIPSLSTEGASSLSEASPFYFITIQSDKIGELRFEMEDGTPLSPVSTEGASPFAPLKYAANAHHGSLKAPIILKPMDETGVYKVIENNHVVIIRNNEKYDVTGKKL